MNSKISHIKIKDFLWNKKILIGILAVGAVLIGGLFAQIFFYKCSIKHPEFCDRSCSTDRDCYSNCTCDCGCMNIWEDCEGAIKCATPRFPCKCVNNTCEVGKQEETKLIFEEQFCSGETLEKCDGKRVCLIGVVNIEPAGKNYGYKMSDGVEWNDKIINGVIINSSQHNLKIPLAKKIEVKGIVHASREVKDDGSQHLLGFEDRLYDPTVIVVEEIRELREEEISIDDIAGKELQDKIGKKLTINGLPILAKGFYIAVDGNIENLVYLSIDYEKDIYQIFQQYAYERKNVTVEGIVEKYIHSYGECMPEELRQRCGDYLEYGINLENIYVR
jgi:hypothetical protein